ncbi:MAG: response regulator transcription factor [Treponema sp.]|nr:response regulator transcription factor [Treponema sp.]
MKNSLFIVDDHSMLKNGLKNYLETNTAWFVTGTFSTGTECLAELQKRMLKKAAGLAPEDELPDLIIVDIQLINDESGFTLVQQLRNKYPQIKIVMYSMYDTWGFVLQAKDLGVEGYISKVASDEKLVRCLNIVRDGGTYYEKKSESIQQELESILPVLKKQEKTVFEMALQGKTNKQISDELFISLHTVENYISYLIKLAGCKNRDELIEKYK